MFQLMADMGLGKQSILLCLLSLPALALVFVAGYQIAYNIHGEGDAVCGLFECLLSHRVDESEQKVLRSVRKRNANPPQALHHPEHHSPTPARDLRRSLHRLEYSLGVGAKSLFDVATMKSLG